MCIFVTHCIKKERGWRFRFAKKKKHLSLRHNNSTIVHQLLSFLGTCRFPLYIFGIKADSGDEADFLSLPTRKKCQLACLNMFPVLTYFFYFILSQNVCQLSSVGKNQGIMHTRTLWILAEYDVFADLFSRFSKNERKNYEIKIW